MRFYICRLVMFSIFFYAVSSAFFMKQSLAEYYVFILERTEDSWRPIVECEATSAVFGYKIGYGYSMDGCSMASDPAKACSHVKPPAANTTFLSCVNSFAVIARGNCSFAQKVWEVQQGGYQAAIVYNERGSDPIPMGRDGKYDTKVHIPAIMVSFTCMEALIERYPFTKGFMTMIRTPPPYDLVRYLIPFLAVVGFCFFMLVVALVIKIVRDRRRQMRRRLSRRNLRKIPTRKYKKGEEPDTCPICLDEFEEGDKLRVLPCKHVYHCKCVDPWLTKNRKVCPVCKRKVGGSGDTTDSDSDTNTGATGGQSERAPLISGAPSPLSVGNSTFYSQYQSTIPREAGQYISPPSSPEPDHPTTSNKQNGEELIQLPDGQVVNNRYRVMKKLGEGGFGAVFKVQDTQTNNLFALKTEGVKGEVQILKMEVYVLEALARSNNRHFAKIEDKGRNNQFNFVVMTLLGQSLQDLRKASPQQKFSMGTALRLGQQCLEALEDLHSIGYLHRDVKPGNFAVGRAEVNELRKVYVLDFGMCRKFVNDRGAIRTPRSAAGFRGTVRYAPINCHLNRELSRKDDLETWFYQQVEITKGALPWKDVDDKDKVGHYKERVRQEPAIKELLGGCPREYIDIMRYIDNLRYYDTPIYEHIYTWLRNACKNLGVKDSDPYDHEQGGGGGGGAPPPAPALGVAARPFF